MFGFGDRGKIGMLQLPILLPKYKLLPCDNRKRQNPSLGSQVGYDWIRARQWTRRFFEGWSVVSIAVLHIRIQDTKSRLRFF